MAVTKTFSDAGISDGLFIHKGGSFFYSVDYSSDFDGGLILERSVNGGISWDVVRNFGDGFKTDVGSTEIELAEGNYRFRCTLVQGTLTGTAAITLDSVPLETVTYLINAAGQAKAGATAGFVVAAGDNIGLVTCPASKTAATCVVPLPTLKVGDLINSFHLNGQIESAGGTVTVDANLRVHTAVASDVTDASVGSITQLTATADTVMSSANTKKNFLNRVVAAGETYYVLITVTTAALTDIALQSVGIELGA